MEIGARDAKPACRERLVSVILAHGRDGELDFVFVNLAFKGAGRLVFADVDDILKAGGLVFLNAEEKSAARTVRRARG